MRSSLAIAAFVATALAVPYNKEHKRELVTAWEYVTSYEVVTTTAGRPPPVATPEESPPHGHHVHHVHHHNNHNNNNNNNNNNGNNNNNNPPPPVYETPAPPEYNTPAPVDKPKTYTPPVEVPHLEKPKTYTPPVEVPHVEKPKAEQAPSYSGPTTEVAPDDYPGRCVYHHNLHRSNHSVSNIQWSGDLADTALKIAKSCIYGHNTEVDGGGYGQNIAAGVAAKNVSAIITDLFYNGEEPYFRGQYGLANPNMIGFHDWGHFSQVVWKGTEWVGCASYYCSDGLANAGDGVEPWFTVCNYSPPGNYAGEYASNVLEPLGHPTANWNTGSS